MSIAAIIATFFIAAGVFFTLIAAIGFIRLPDVFCRLHVTCITDTLGAPLILLGTAVWLGPTLVSAKVFLALVFLFLTSPLVGHLLARAAMEAEYEAFRAKLPPEYVVEKAGNSGTPQQKEAP